MNKRILHLLAILVLLVSALPAIIPGTAAGDEGAGLPQYERPENLNPKLDSRLNQLVEAEASMAGASLAQTTGIDVIDGNIRVIIDCHPGQVDAVAINAINLGTIEASYQDMLQMTVPVFQLTALTDISGVRVVTLPVKPVAFDITAEGLTTINADDWQTAGYTGAGVRVGVLDIGFAGYEAMLGTELPGTVHTWWAPSIGGPGSDVHGTACAEVVHDIAPGAELYLANYGTLVEMGDAVDWFISEGVDVITNSTGWPALGGGDGTGPACDVIAAAHAADIYWSQAIGNCANSHWMGTFTDLTGGGVHEFVPGVDELNSFFAPAGFLIDIALRWDDPWGAAINDYDLLLLNDAVDTILEVSAAPQSSGFPFAYEEIFIPAPYTGFYNIVIIKHFAVEDKLLHLMSYPIPLEHMVTDGSYVMGADSPYAAAIGAVHWNYPSTIEPYSSWGPTDDGRTIPSVVGLAAVSTASYGSSNGQPYGPGATGFFGTSCATPYAAGAATLVRGAYPGLSADEVLAFLKDNSADLGVAGPDNTYGWGRVDLGSPPVAETGTISGHVYEADGQTPIAGAVVQAFNSYNMIPMMWQPDGTAITGPDGSYTITGLPAGDYYRVAAVASSHERRWWQNTQLLGQVTPLTLAAGQTIGNIDFTLGPGGTISGTITDQNTGLPIANVSVYPSVPPFQPPNFLAATKTDTNGNYVLDGVPYGNYVVVTPLYNAEGDDNYIVEFWQEKHFENYTMADLVNVSEVSNPTGINFTLEAGACISGYVRTEGGAPILGVTLFVWEYAPLTSGGPWVLQGAGGTDANGYYRTSGLPNGTYALHAISTPPGYLSEFWDNIYLPQSATPIVVTGPGEITGKDFYLAPAGSISGHVQDSQGNAIPNLHVHAFDAVDNKWVAGVNTDNSGDYTLAVPSGNYLVHTCVQCSGLVTTPYIDEWYDNVSDQKQGTPVQVNAPGNIPNINFTLEVGGTISGHVQDSQGNAITNFNIQVVDPVNGNFIAGTNTDNSGNYAFTLPAGNYHVRTCATCNGQNYLDEYYDNALSQAGAALVPVYAGQTTSNINFVLEAGGTISGHVQDSQGNPIANVHVYAVDATNNQWKAGGTNTDSSGNYTLIGIPTGSYFVGTCVRCSGTVTTPYLDEWYNNTFFQNQGTAVQVTAPGNTPNINFTLEEGATISGHVRNSQGNAIANLHVNAQDFTNNAWIAGTNTAQDGSYTLVVLPGIPLRIMAHSLNPYAGEYYDNTYNANEATPVLLNAPGNTAIIDFILDIGGTITGHVQNSQGNAIPNLHVNASDYVTNSWLDGTNTDQNGNYTVVVPEGTYRVGAWPPTNPGMPPYISEYYNNKIYYNEADVVPVSTGQTTPNINFTLELGGTISGYVYQADGQTPIFNLHVQVFDSINNTWMGGSNTNAAGYYAINLPAGTYKVHTCPCCSGNPYIEKWYNNKTSQAAADNVTVTVPNNTGNINFILEATVTRPSVEAAIADGVAWLASQQNPDGSWGTLFQVSKTALAVLKLIKYASEVEPPINPLDPQYPYSGNIIAGFNYLFSRADIAQINPQPAGNPDTRPNGVGIYFYSPNYPSTMKHPYDIYEASITLMAFAEAAKNGLGGLPVSIPGHPEETLTLADVVQDIVDYLAWGQTDSGPGHGGWNYLPTNNDQTRSDQSNSGWVTLGLMYAEDYLLNDGDPNTYVPGWVMTELDFWINYIQVDVTGSPDDGGSYYCTVDEGWVPAGSILRTGNLLQQMAFIEDTLATPRVQAALNFMTTYWNDTSTGRGWRGCPAIYQATYTAMKGLEQIGVEMLGATDWYQDLADVIMSQQSASGWWPVSSYDDGEKILSTEWALLTLEKEAPETQILPDLIITDGHINWINPGVYVVNLTVKNQGNASTVIPFGVLITVDGQPAQPPIPVPPLDIGQAFTIQSLPITLSDVQDTIIIYVDSDGVIPERFENNNSVTLAWPLPDLIISEKHEEWVQGEEGQRYTMHFTVTNVGDAIAPQGYDVRIIISPGHFQDVEVPVDLAPGESWTNPGPWLLMDFSGAMDTVIVNADVFGEVTELNEWNNVKINSFSLPAKPDLVATNIHEEWIDSGIYLVHYTVYNQGNAVAYAGHETSLTVDEQFIQAQVVPVDLAPGESHSGTFTAPITISGGWDTVVVTADYNNAVDESAEFPNSSVYTVAKPPAPNLTSLIIGQVWIDQDTYQVQVFVFNNGNAVAPAGFDVSLSVNGALKEVLPVTRDLPPGQLQLILFTTAIDLHGSPDMVTVCADANQEVSESREDDNCWTQELPPPPADLIISEKHEEWVDEGQTYKVYFTVKNIGQGTARAGHSVSLNIDFGAVTETKIVPVELGPGESWSSSFDAVVTLSQGTDIVIVSADASNPPLIYEADELNNSNLNSISWPPKPDLSIANMWPEWESDGVYVMHFTLINSGNAVALPNHAISLTIDGAHVETFGIAEELNPGETFSDAFINSHITVDGGWDTVMVCADANNEVDEINEDFNCRTDTVAWPPAPDLEILIKNEVWVDDGIYNVICFVRNSGNALAPGRSDVLLIVDGNVISTQELAWPMQPGEAQLVVFPNIQLSGAYDEITVIADASQEMDESREDNNTLTNYWPTPPPPTVTVSVNAPTNVVPDTNFTATIDITEVSELNAAQYDIHFDPTVLRLDSIDNGVVGGQTLVADYNELGPGHWRVVQYPIIMTSSVSGSGFMAVLHFHAIGVLGEYSDITLTDGLLSNMDAVAIPATWIGDSVNISILPGDANGDGVINVLDMTKVARIILQLDPPTPGADANQDGTINVLDMTRIAQIILGRYPSGILRIATADFGNESTDPINLESMWGWAMYDTLLSYDAEGNIIPNVAESWSVSDNGCVWTFHIRQGIKFHNGDPLTAADVKFSVDRFGDTSISTNPWSWYLSTGYNKVSSRVVNPYTFEYVTDHPEPTLVIPFAWVRILPKNYFESVGQDYFRAHPIGSGPWKFVKHIPETKFAMVANTGYWGEVPHYQYVLDIQVPDEAQRVALLQAGMVDIVPGLSMDNIVQLEGEGYLTAEVGPPTQANITFQGTWLPQAGPVSDIRVRQAMSYALNRQAICETFYHGKAVPGGLFYMHPGGYGWDESLLPDTYNPALAASELAAAGYPLAFPDPVIHLYTPAGTSADFLQICQPYWTAAGIITQIHIVDSATYIGYLFNPTRMDGDEPNVGWIFPWIYPSFFNSTYHAANMYCSWGVHNAGNDQQADFLYNKAISEFNPVLAEQYYREFQQYAEQMYVNIGICMADSLVVKGPRVGEFTSKAYMDLYDALAGILHPLGSEPQPQYGGVLKLAGSQSPTNIGNPNETAVPTDAGYALTACEGLLRLDSQGNLQPWLAESWEIDSDGSYVIFYLRHGVKFHDGTDFNAEAAKYNIDNQINSTVWPNMKPVASCDILGDYTIRLNFVDGKFNWQVMNSLANFFSCLMFSPTALQTQTAEWLRTHPVGTGPFLLAEYSPEKYLRFVRFDNYWGGRPYLDGIEYIIMSDGNTQLAAFTEGDIHAISLQPNQAATVISHGFEVRESIGLVFNMCLIPDSNNPSSPFADIRVRQALEYAIDKQTLVNVLTYGYGHVSNQVFIQGQAAYNPGTIGYPYNQTIARALLTEAGYPSGFQTQLLILDFMPLDLYNAIKDMLAEVGIEVEFNLVSIPEFVDQVTNSGWTGLVPSCGFAGTLADPSSTLINGPLNNNTIWVSNQQPEEAYNLSVLAVNELNPAIRTLLYQQISKMLTDDYAQWCYLYWTPALSSLSPKVHGADFDHSSYSYAHAWLVP